MPQHFLTPYREPNKSAHMRAKGNLSYREFIRVVQTLWRDAHLDIPILASGGDQHATYPVIIYSLQLRKPHPSEPKPRLREHIYTPPTEEAKIISGQRFQNIVNFSVLTERNPDLAEELIEAFEDFMLEYTPVYKELGISEFVYARRLPDDEENRKGEGICKRTVSYLVTTEKVIETRVAKLDRVLVRARLALSDQATFVASEITDAITVHGASFNVGDIVSFERRDINMFPASIQEGRVYYIHTVLPTSEGGFEYRLAEDRDVTKLPLELSSGQGYIFRARTDTATEAVDLHLEDQFLTGS